MHFHLSRYTFIIPDEYSAGQPISHAEAWVLNSAKADVIREAVRTRFNALEGGQAGAQLLSQETLDEFQRLVSRTAAAHEFRIIHRSPPKDSLTAEIARIVEMRLEAERRHAPEGGSEARRAELLTSPAIRDEARAVIEAKLAALRTDLEELLAL